MRKVIVLVGFMSCFGAKANSFSHERVAMKDYIAVPDMDYVFEVVTDQYQKVILDCQGIAGGLRFYNEKKMKHQFYLDNYSHCPAMHDFFKKSQESQLPVCLDIEADEETNEKILTVSNDEDCL